MSARGRSLSRVAELDIAAKGILGACPVPLLRLLLPGLDVVGARPDEKELVAQSLGDGGLRPQARKLDKLFELEVRGRREPLSAVVEVAASWSADVPRQVFEYWSPVHLARGEVEAVALVLKPGQRQGRPRGLYALEGRSGPQLQFRFGVVCAWNLEADAILRRDEPGLLPLLPFTAGATPDRVHAALRRLSAVRSRRVRADLQASLAAFAGNVFTDVDWLAKLPREILMESTVYKQILAEGEARGRAAERSAHARECLLEFLAAQLPDVAERLTPRLERLAPAELESLFRQVLRSPLARVEALLERQLAEPPPT